MILLFLHIFFTCINLYIYKVIRDLCAHMNDSLISNDVEIAKLNFRLQETEIKNNLT